MIGLKLLGAAIEGFASGYPPKLFLMLLPLSGVLEIGFLLPVIGDGDLFGEAAMIFLEDLSLGRKRNSRKRKEILLGYVDYCLKMEGNLERGREQKCRKERNRCGFFECLPTASFLESNSNDRWRKVEIPIFF